MLIYVVRLLPLRCPATPPSLFSRPTRSLTSHTPTHFHPQPVFIKHRNDEQIAAVAGPAPASEYRDPQTDAERAVNPKWLVVVGVCTHLGCVPIPNAGDFHGWYCPCHGSHYDGSGRIRKGPAPLNLEIPTYKFMPGNKLLLG